jgi:hypothetical protein
MRSLTMRVRRLAASAGKRCRAVLRAIGGEDRGSLTLEAVLIAVGLMAAAAGLAYAINSAVSNHAASIR